MFDAFKRSGKPGGNDWPRLVVLSIILSLRAYNADYDDDDIYPAENVTKPCHKGLYICHNFCHNCDKLL